MKTFYVHFNNHSWFVKTAEFFDLQGGHNRPWGKAWKAIQADSIEDARNKAELERTNAKRVSALGT